MKAVWLGTLALLVVGCSAVTETTVVGKYKGVVLEDKGAGTIANNLASGLASSMSVEIKPDNTFHMVMAVVPVDGKWSLDGATLTLTPDKVLGIGRSDVPVGSAKPMKFRVVEGRLEPSSTGPESRFRFVKEGSEGETTIP